jgi:hypothetical protein
VAPGACSRLQAPSRPTRIGSLRRFITAAHLQEPLTNCRRRPVHHSLRAAERAESRRAQYRGPEEDLLELAGRLPANGGLPGPDPEQRWFAAAPAWLAFQGAAEHLRTMAFEAHGARLRRWLTESPLTWQDSPKSLWWEGRSRRTPAAGGVAVRPGTARGHAHPTRSVPAPVRNGFAPGRDRKGRALQSLKAPGGGYLSSWSTTRLHGPHVRVPSPKRRHPTMGMAWCSEAISERRTSGFLHPPAVANAARPREDRPSRYPAMMSAGQCQARTHCIGSTAGAPRVRGWSPTETSVPARPRHGGCGARRAFNPAQPVRQTRAGNDRGVEFP